MSGLCVCKDMELNKLLTEIDAGIVGAVRLQYGGNVARVFIAWLPIIVDFVAACDCLQRIGLAPPNTAKTRVTPSTSIANASGAWVRMLVLLVEPPKGDVLAQR